MTDFARMLAGLAAGSDDDDTPPRSIRQQVIAALQAAAALQTPRDFEVGDFVMLKPGCKTQRFPTESEPCLVLQIEAVETVPLKVGQEDEHSSDGNAGKRENVLIGSQRGDNFATWWVDERALCRHAKACAERDEYLSLMKSADAA